jgi:hypothetical protein
MRRAPSSRLLQAELAGQVGGAGAGPGLRGRPRQLSRGGAGQGGGRLRPCRSRCSMWSVLLRPLEREVAEYPHRTRRRRALALCRRRVRLRAQPLLGPPLERSRAWPLREVRRVLKPGGVAAFIDVISPGSPLFDTYLQTCRGAARHQPCARLRGRRVACVRSARPGCTPAARSASVCD